MTDTTDIKNQIRREKHKRKVPNKKRLLKRLFQYCMLMLLVGFAIVIGIGIWYYNAIYPNLPAIESIQEIKLSVPSKIYTADGKLISEFGDKKRNPISFADIPPQMINAVIAAEDSNFFAHKGLDVKAIVRAALEIVKQGKVTQGGSTITMQVIRNFLLSREKTFLRKANEIVLALKLESIIDKDEILVLYFNKIFFGYRSYGLIAAANTYYGKKPKELSLDEIAMIAGLPKAPSAFNPIINPVRAKSRRQYVLSRMRALNFITAEEEKIAKEQPVHAKLHTTKYEVEADYIAEMTRQFMIEKLGIENFEEGLNIYTTIKSDLQTKAQVSVRKGLQNYSERHGYRGPIKNYELNTTNNVDTTQQILAKTRTLGGLQAGIVTKVGEQNASVVLNDNKKIELTWKGISWVAPYINVHSKGKHIQNASEALTVGDLILLSKDETNSTIWRLSQYNEVESALVSINSHTGAIQSLVGGYDFHSSKFNRVTQALRQIGSTFKPILYSAALAKGYSVSTLINDAPVVYRDKALEGTWKPENYSGRSYGPTRLRLALAFSRNLVSIRLLQAIGVNYVIDYAQNFGLPKQSLLQSKNLSLALGSLSVTMIDVARAYMVLSNGGYLIEPYFVEKVVDRDGDILYETPQIEKCDFNCKLIQDKKTVPRVINAHNRYLITDVLQDVVSYGTGKSANKINRTDIAGKTGTTNDLKDAWFVGFNPNIVTVVWTGFDQPKTMGRREFGGRASLPTWLDYMQYALANEPDIPFKRPNGLVNIRIDRETGLATNNVDNSIFETFREEYAPIVLDADEKTTEINKLVDQIF